LAKSIKGSKSNLKKQALAEAFSSYNKKTGFLVNRYWDWGLEARFYQNVDPRVPVDEMIKLYEPEVSFTVKALDMDNYTSFKAKAETKVEKDILDKIWYPAQDSNRSAHIIGIFHGSIKVDNSGNYTFVLRSNNGATFNVTDTKTEKSTVGLVDTAGEPVGQSEQTLSIKGPQMANIMVYWHSPPVGTDHVLHLQYSGPDTDGQLVDLMGSHWLNDQDLPPFKPLDPATLKPGFGCRFTYPTYVRVEVPQDVKQFRNITPDWVAEVPALQIKNHEDLEELKTKAADLGGAGDLKANVPTRQVLAYCEGYVNISQGGSYVFAVKNDGGFKLTVDKVAVTENRTEHDAAAAAASDYDPTTADKGPILLPKGYHQVRVSAILSSYNPVTRPMGQELGLSYKGPDTLDGADADAEDGKPTVPVHGYYQVDKFGDVGSVVTKLGKSRNPRYLGGGGAFAPERNPLENFDKDWFDENKNKAWKKYDYGGQDWDKDINDVAVKIVKPWTDNTAQANAYADDGATRKIPDAVYERPPPYDPAVVDIGGKGIPWVHQEKSNELSGEKAVIGSEYVFHKWDKTINSVPEAGTNLDMPDSVEYGGGVGTPPTTFGGIKGK